MKVDQLSAATTPSDQQPGRRVLQRTILPERGALDVASLYVDSGAAVAQPKKETVGRATVQIKGAAQASAIHVEDILSRTSFSVRPGERVSFGSYFNAFAASYWRRWSVVESVDLSVHTSGPGTVMVFKSNARGSLQLVETRLVEGDTTSDFALPLTSFGDGGWYWFELLAGSEPLLLVEADWSAATDRTTVGRVTLQITTMNKPDFCVDNLRLLADHAEASELLEQIVIVDQGDRKVVDHEDFADVATRLAGRLRIIDQSNLGGSGGFARGMYEAVQAGSDYALLLDDDVVIEPESISRMLAFGDLAKSPTIVGGHMFDLYNRTVLHTFGEVVDPYRFFWVDSNDDMEAPHDFAESNLRQTSWMHRRFDVDYNAWWMCLIPTRVIREVGLALPVFIKWDDAEFGVRAKEQGFPTASLPGSAVWHVSWADKDDMVGWQAYFHARNRIVSALLHSPYDRGGRIPRELYYHDVKHLLSMQYATVALRNEALKDAMRGPGHLPTLLGTKLPEIRAMLAEHPDSQFRPSVDQFPEPRLAKPPRRGRGTSQPSRVVLVPWAAKTFVRQLAKPVEESSRERPQAHVAHQDNRWWRMSQYDSAVVSNAEGTAASWYQRDPAKLRALLAESVRLHTRLFRDWERLRSQYRAAAHDLTSMESWGKIFAEHTHGDRRY